MKCLEMLNVSPFFCAARLSEILESFQSRSEKDNEFFNLQFVLAGKALSLGLYSRSSDTLLNSMQNEFFIRLSEPPSFEHIEKIKQDLSFQSEVSDPELLRQHNENIRKEMQAAEARAVQEL